MRTIADEIFEDTQITPHIVLETENIETVLAFSAQGMGITFYPRMFMSSKQNLNAYHDSLMKQAGLNLFSLNYPEPTVPWPSAITKATTCPGPPMNLSALHWSISRLLPDCRQIQMHNSLASVCNLDDLLLQLPVKRKEISPLTFVSFLLY